MGYWPRAFRPVQAFCSVLSLEMGLPHTDPTAISQPWHARLAPMVRASGGRHLNQLIVLIGATSLMVVVALVSAFLVIDNRAAGTEVLQAQHVTTDVARLLILLQRAESGQRGYFLTANRDYLDRYNDSMSKIYPTLEAVTEALKGHPAQQVELLNLRSVIGAKIGEMTNTISLFESGRRDDAMAIVRSNQGKVLMDQIRTSIAAIWTESTRQSQERIDSWRANGNWLFVVQLGAAILVLLVSGLAVVSGVRHTRGLQATQETLRAANESLEERVRARTADLQEANEEVQKFAYMISHDLRSPLVNIMGFAAELATIRAETAALLGSAPPIDIKPRDPSVIDQDFGEALSFIQQSTTKMDRLISAVLRLARSGQRQFQYEKLDMTALLNDIAATLRHQTVESGTEIVIENLPDLVSDRLAVEQIFGNLLDNAVKYLDDSRLGRIVIRAQLLRRAVLFEVEDNGRGIEPHDLKRIFDLFRRGGRQDRPGEGIGLAHLRVLIRRLGGKISCRSDYGKGSVFSVLLPQGDLSPDKHT